MRSINFYHPKSSGKKKNTAGRASLAAAFVCMLMSFFAVNQAHAQAATRTSTVIVGASPFQDSLWTINAADYTIVKHLAPSMTGYTITGINGLATHPMTGEHYAIVKVSGGGNRRLVKINVQTGVCTLIGDLGDNFSSITFNANGTLFGVTGDGANVPETMYRINLADATTTFFRTLGNGLDGEVICYNSDDHKFYHWSGNSTVVFERFDTSGVDPIESLTFTGAPGGETFGAGYLGGGVFLIGNISSSLRTWTMSGTDATIGSSLMSTPDDLRGLVRESHTTIIDPWSSTTICSGSGVTLEVTGGTGGYTWYKDGTVIPGATDATYMATSAGLYNSVYADINGIIDSPTTGITVTMLPDPGITFSANPQVCLGATTASISYSTSMTMPTSGVSTYNVPWGVTSVNFDLMGGGGGADTGMAPNPGMGGRVQGTLAVNPGDVLNIYVGGQGHMGTSSGALGGFNGGGSSLGYGGSGGGATDIRLNGANLADRVAVAGGGAGSGNDGMFSVMGGFGGSTTGGNGEFNLELSQAMGGTPTAGGAGALYTLGNGMDGAFGIGGASSDEGVSGGGGAGYYGGGGGAWSGGGGGSSYTDALLASSVTHTAGVNAGDGSATMSFDIPSGYTYAITWDVPATTAGFTDVAATAFPAGGAPIDFSVPATATPDTYTGMMYISNGTCTISQPISVTVKPIPDVTATNDQAACNGATTTDVMFTGSLPGTTFNWTNSLGTVGIPTSGSGDIMGFTAINPTADTAIATITVTPELNGCFGTADAFDIIVKPTPMLSVVNAGTVCDNTVFNYTATSATEGTTFAWERAALTGDIVAAANSDATATISETFDNTGINVIGVAYSYTLTAAGCVNVETMTMSVNPTPVLTGTMLPTVCSGSAFMYTQSSATSGVAFTWSREAVAGISEAASSGAGDINEILTSTVTTSVTVTYIDTLDINGCKYTEPISVVVNPMPHLTSALADSVCDNAIFDYDATSDVAGTTITWERFPVTGITSGYMTGPDTVNESHHNTTDEPVVTTYMFTMLANGCTNMQNMTLMVNPTPQLNTTLTPAAICDSTFFSYTPGSNTSNATFTWTRATVPNITNAAGAGAGSVNERLNNSASFSVPVTYVYTSHINGCTNAQNVVVNVNPTPKLSNSLPLTAICDSALFTFAPASATVGTSYAWTRPFVIGIPMLSASGTGNISEHLDNGTNNNVTVNYIYTLTANGCQHVQTVPVVVHPTPMINNLTDSACSGVPFVYTPETFVSPAVKYSWIRLPNSSITPSTASDTAGINETLNNSGSTAVTVSYAYTVTIAGSSCATKDTLKVLVRPSAAAPIIATTPAATLCNGVMYQNFGAQDPAATGTSYTWSATNAEVYATGAGNQYALVNFNVANTTAVIKLTSTVGATGCIGVATYTVNVGGGTAEPAPKVIYTKGKFICLQNNVKHFQWGYDDAATLDSIAIAGEINQSYFEPSPKFGERYYWVAINSADGSCTRKAYYNTPNDNTPRETIEMGGEEVMAINVFPNPTNNVVNVEVKTEVPGAITVELVNALGQKINSSDAVNNKASFNVANLPGGFYMVDCYQEGHKIGSAKFVKN